MADLSSNREPAPNHDAVLNRLADEFAARFRRGERPALREYADKYPDLAADIHDLFPALVEIEQIKEDAGGFESTLIPPFKEFGDYRILREIGRGGMGVVYEAEQVSLGRHVALKVLPQKWLVDRKTRLRFEREAKAAAKLHHTNIVPVFGVGEQDGLPYFVMQYIQGLGLDEVIEELKRVAANKSGDTLSPGGAAGLAARAAGSPRTTTLRAVPLRDFSATDAARSLMSGVFQRPADAPTVVVAEPGSEPLTAAAAAARQSPLTGRIPDVSSPSSVILPGQGDSSHEPNAREASYWQSVARIGIQVASALDYAHKQGVLHRDIKPSNLLLDRHGTVWVTDFGLAKADDQEDLTQTGDMVGTLRYMPSESFEGKSDARSDVYSLGLTLYELLALRPAFDESHRHRLFKQISDRAHLPLDRLSLGIPRDLVTVVHKAIDRDPGHRYQSAAELAADLQNLLDDRPIQARRPSVVERLSRWSRHHPGLAVSLAAIWLLLTVGFAGAIVAAARFGRMAGENRDLATQRESQRIKAEEAGQEAQKRGDAERWERYRADIAAAGTALQFPSSAAARSALSAAPEEYRGWEWRHFKSRLDDARGILPLSYRSDRPASEIGQAPLAFDSQGKLVWAGSPDGALLVWDAATGRQVGMLPGRGSLDAMLGPDGRLLVMSRYGELRSWDLRRPDASLLWEIPVGDVRGQFIGPGGRLLLGGQDQRVCLWERSTGRKRADLPGRTRSGQCTAVFAPDGRHVAYSTDDSAVHVWDAQVNAEIHTLRGHCGYVRALAFSPDGKILASGASYPDNSVRLWSVSSGQPLAELRGHHNEVSSVAFSRDGSRLASSSMDQTARLWDPVAGKPIATLKHSGIVRQVVFSPDGRRLISASHDATLRLWDAKDGALIAVLGGHTGEVLEAAFSPDGAVVASWSPVDATVRLWDLAQVERNGVLRGHTSYVYDVSFSPDGTQILSASWDGTARLWDPTSGREIGRFDHSKQSGEGIVVAACYSPDGRQITSVMASGAVSSWDVASRHKLRDFQIRPGDYRGYPRGVFQLQGHYFAIGSGDGAVTLMDANCTAPIAILRGHKGSALTVAFSPDGTQLASCGVDGTVRLWDLSTRSTRAVLNEPGAGIVYSVAYSADGRLLASAAHDKTVRVWSTATRQLVAVLPHGSAVYSVAFSPDGRRLAAGCADNSIRLWDVATAERGAGREVPEAGVAELYGHESYVHAVAWSPDGTRLASASGDFTVRIWDSVPPAVRAQSASAAPSR